MRDPAAPFVLLEDRLGGTPALLFEHPVEIVETVEPGAVQGALARLEVARRAGRFAAGFLSYELGYLHEARLRPLLPQERALPLLWFAIFEAPREIDPGALDAWFANMAPVRLPDDAVPSVPRERYIEGAATVLDLIRAGECYQANLTFDLDFRLEGDPLALYGALRVAQPAAHAGLVVTDRFALLSVSPELFVELHGDRARMRPMKGTLARGGDPTEDQGRRLELREDPKQRAENLMIVDLLRNDLARIARPGSVRVPQLFEVETYPTLHAMTSTVEARLPPLLPLGDLVAALFPCASVVGAPKARAMEILHDLEDRPRGAYTGAIGHFGPDGDLAFNVAIRTATLWPDGRGCYGVGSGIVADSDPASEHAECLLKGQILADLAKPLSLIETMRWEPDLGIQHRARHLARLAASAKTLGFAYDARRIETALDAAVPTHADGAHRVRLTLDRDGMVSVAITALDPDPPWPLRLHLAAARLDPGDALLRHKTTRRRVYETAFAQACEAGCDEALLLNRRGELAEASRANIFLESAGRLLTPHLDCGLLPGVLRAWLIETGAAEEAVLSVEDLRCAGRVFVGSALRGLRPAVLA